MQGDTCSYCKKYNRVDELHKTNRHPLWQKWLYCHGKGSAGGPWNGETRTNGQIKGRDEDHREHGMYPTRHAVGAAAKSYCNYSKNWKTDSTAGEKVGLVFKEMKVGFFNGLFLGIMAFIFIGLYIWLLKGNPVVHAFVISGCVGFSLMAAMVISSLVGTLIPMFFHKIKIDPAVASGPLITTVNDLVAVVIYYGLVWILLIHFLHMV